MFWNPKNCFSEKSSVTRNLYTKRVPDKNGLIILTHIKQADLGFTVSFQSQGSLTSLSCQDQSQGSLTSLSCQDQSQGSLTSLSCQDLF